MTTVHAQEDYHILPQGDTPAGYPAAPVPDSFQTHPGSTTNDQRRVAFIDHVLRNPAPKNTKPVWYELVRLAGGQSAHEGIIHAALDFIDARQDCADFVQHGILRMLFQFNSKNRENQINVEHPLSEDVLDRAKQTTLNFKYFPDEPGIDSMCTWTENHYILFTSAAYLAGQMYPDEVFQNSGETGQQKMVRNRPRIMRWLEMHFRTGFNEWLSHVYYDEDLTALLSLYDFCEDPEIRAKAAMVIDLLLLDMALNSFRGVFGATHGRAYENTKKWASNEGTTDTLKLLFGMGVYSAFDNMSAAAFLLSRYRVPPAITAIAQDLDRVFTNRQRMGFRIQDAEKWGLSYNDFESGMFFLTNEAYLHPCNAALTMQMFDAFNWWENAFFQDFQPYRKLLAALGKLKLLRLLARVLEKDVSRNMRQEPNVYTYRTPDYMLSTAQDHRAGYGGDQHHIWQATLGPDAVCFTTHPAKIEGASPNYWAGSGLLPRAAQVKNLVIAVYNLKKIPALYVPIRHFYTHAWLPRDKFDQVVEEGGWIFTRLGEGYLALRSMQPYFWNQAEARHGEITFRQAEEDFQREVIAAGRRNIWICQLGRQQEDGPFQDFIQRIKAARLSYKGLQVKFDSPGIGCVEFGWQGPLRVGGKPVPLRDYPRYENPYVNTGFDPAEILVQAGGHQLRLNYGAGIREVS